MLNEIIHNCVMFLAGIGGLMVIYVIGQAMERHK